MPVPIGVLRAIDRPVYEDLLEEQVARARETLSGDLGQVFRQGDTWSVGSKQGS
jgi:2-oxoglutarate ferredoxin oxidoreductase subunit beta